MANAFDVQKKVQYQLAAARHQARSDNTSIEVEPSSLSDTPTWLVHNLTAQQQLANQLTTHYHQLLNQLPLVAQTQNAAAQATYIEQLTSELAKLYYIRMRCVSLNDQLTTTAKQSQLQRLATACATETQHVINVMDQFQHHYAN